MTPSVREYEEVEFAAAIPEADARPLLLLRQAVYDWRVAAHRAARLRAVAEAAPDSRLSRCAAHREREAESRLGQLGGAAAAWKGERRGRLFICEREEKEGYLCVAWGAGRPATARDVQKNDRLNSPTAVEVLRLGEMELLLALGAAERVIEDQAQRTLTIKILSTTWSDRDRGDLARGDYTIAGLVASAAWTAHFRLERNG